VIWEDLGLAKGDLVGAGEGAGAGVQLLVAGVDVQGLEDLGARAVLGV